MPSLPEPAVDNFNHRSRPWTRLAASMSQQFLRADSTTSIEKVLGIDGIFWNVANFASFLTNEQSFLQTEGVFRKNGSMLRQREISQRLLTSENVEFPLQTVPMATSSQTSLGVKRPRICKGRTDDNLVLETRDFIVHDYTSALKRVIADISEPILTHDLLPVFAAVAELTEGNVNEKGERTPLESSDLQFAQAKQLNAIRTLRFLLPRKNQTLLRRILDLLTETLKYTETNLMSVSSLGTLFGPILLAKPDVSLISINMI